MICAGSIYQDVATSAGARYALSFSYAGDFSLSGDPGCTSADQVKKMDVFWDGALLRHVTFDTTGRTQTDMGWQRASLLVTATGASSRLRFTSLSDGWCGVTLDDVALTIPGASQTFTTVASSADPVVWGQAATFTATVVGASAATTPTGSVRFEVDGSPAGASVPVDAAGHASFTSNSLSVGTHTITATFQPSSASYMPARKTSPRRLPRPRRRQG